MKKSEKKFRNFAFTDFNLENLNEYKTIKTTICSYMILGEEKATKTKRLHYQGFVMWKSPKTFSACLKKLPQGIHLEHCYSTAINNMKYCEKEGNLKYEIGERPVGQGKRSDFVVVRTLLAEGASMNEIIDLSTSYQSVRSAEIIRRYKQKKRKVQPIEIIWLWGETGTGKTRWCFDNYPDLYRVCDNHWWCGYETQDTILIDDLRADWFSYRKLLQYTDIYPFSVQIKGTHAEVQFTRLLITSPLSPSQMFAHLMEENNNQLLRRITKIKYMTIS